MANKIESTDREIASTRLLVDLLTIYLGEKVITTFKKEKLDLYHRILKQFTVIEINGLDRIGLLYDLTEALYKLNLNIASAHVTTFGEKAVDVFYVTDLTGAKIENTTRHKQIESALANILKPAPSTPVKA
jgi:UTP:GlnB (protein PII) uridylyltransferase